MAIEFKEKSFDKKSSFKLDKTAKFFIATLVILLFAWLFLFLYQRFIFASIKTIKSEIQEINKERDVTLEKEMKTNLEKFQKVKTLLDSHKNAKGVFLFLEQNVYQGVTFSGFDFNLKENTVSFNISSTVPQNLAIQIAAFKQAKIAGDQNAVSNVEVGGFSIAEGGAVTLHVKLTLSPSITKF